jgi:hypothetical protein
LNRVSVDTFEYTDRTEEHTINHAASGCYAETWTPPIPVSDGPPGFITPYVPDEPLCKP